MLDQVLDFFSAELNAYFQTRTGLPGDTVVPGQVVNDNGKYEIKKDNIGATIINIEEEGVFKDQLPEVRFQQGQHLQREPKLKLNLFVLFAANYTRYDQALKHLSLVLQYFQGHRVFTPDRYPGLQTGIERLSVDLQTLNYDQLNQIWAYIGGKHLPSIVYRVRLVSIQDSAISQVQPPLTVISTDMGGL